jgi:hypothetical protein
MDPAHMKMRPVRQTEPGTRFVPGLLLMAASLLVLLCATWPTPVHAQCTIQRTRRLPIDSYQARSACEAARKRFGDLFGARAPDVRLLLTSEGDIAAGYRAGRVLMRFPRLDAWGQLARQLGLQGAASRTFQREQMEQTLPHELAHQMLAARFYPAGLPVDSGHYGTPLPDWFDEAVAIWAEPENLRADRLADAQSLVPRLRLAEVLMREHPHAGIDSAQLRFTATRYTREGDSITIRHRSEPRGRTLVDTLREANGATIQTRDLTDFYPVAYSLLAFIVATGGRPAIQELERRLRADPYDTAALNGLPGLPQAGTEIEALWKEWVARWQRPPDNSPSRQ